MGSRHAVVAPAAGAVMVWLAALVGCSPALDWREVRPQGADLAMLFPCRIDSHERSVHLGGQATRMTMHSCRATEAVFSLGVVEAGSPSQVAPMLDAMRSAASEHLGTRSPAPTHFLPKGMTSNASGGLFAMEGHLPDGRPVSLHAAFFVKGLRLYQASIIGKEISSDASETFFQAIRATP